MLCRNFGPQTQFFTKTTFLMSKVSKEIDTYISVDIETDGPVPGRYSMLSLGMALAGSYDGIVYSPFKKGSRCYYVEIKPISGHYDTKSLNATGLDRNHFKENGISPLDAMSAAARWVLKESEGTRPVFVGYPATFDWMFSRYYFEEFSDIGCPFLHSSVLCIKTMYATKARTSLTESVRDKMPSCLIDGLSNDHQALHDAISQAVLFNRIFEWEGRSR